MKRIISLSLILAVALLAPVALHAQAAPTGTTLLIKSTLYANAHGAPTGANNVVTAEDAAFASVLAQLAGYETIGDPAGTTPTSATVTSYNQAVALVSNVLGTHSSTGVPATGIEGTLESAIATNTPLNCHFMWNLFIYVDTASPIRNRTFQLIATSNGPRGSGCYVLGQ